MVTTLRELFAASRHPSHDAKESAAQVLVSLIEQAQAIGHAHATDEEQRGMAWGGKFANALSSAWDIVNNFVQRILDWMAGQDPEDLDEEDIQAEVDTLAERVGSFEIAAAIEQEVVDTLASQGATLMVSVAMPGACNACLERAAADPVPVSDFEPPPYHGGCRCSSSRADENRGVMRSMAENEDRTYTITGTAPQLDQLEKVLSYIQYLGNIGSSRNITIFCDGDGWVRLKVKKPVGNLVKPETEIHPDGDMGISLG